MSGAAGHIKHPYEDLDLKLDDLYAMLRAVAGGRVRLYEKWDGINLLFRRDPITDTMMYARSVGEMKAGGITALELVNRFPSAPNVGTVIYTAARALEKWSSTTRLKEGRWRSIDVCSRDTQNVIRYDRDLISVHSAWVTPEGTRMDGPAFEWLTDGDFCGYHVMTPQPFTITAPGAAAMVLHEGEGGGGNTLGTIYHTTLAEQVKKLGFDDATSSATAARVLKLPEHVSLTELKKGRPKSDAAALSEFVNAEVKHLRAARAAAERLIHDFTDVLLRGHVSAGIDHARHADEIARQRLAYFQQCAVVTAKGDAKYRADMERVDDFSAVQTTMEGVVYQWNNRLYKLTGMFRYTNQVMGAGRFLNR